jgi:hypothetical protein
MSSFWTIPNNFFQYSDSETDIPWNEEKFQEMRNFDKKSLNLNGEIYHIAMSPKNDIKNQTYFLKVTDFKFSNLPTQLTGIELKLTTKKFGRIVDDTIQLCIADKIIGENKATLEVNPVTIYGSFNDLWNTNLSIDDIKNKDFGVVLKFKAHPFWPHKNGMFIDAVEMRIH